MQPTYRFIVPAALLLLCACTAAQPSVQPSNTAASSSSLAEPRASSGQTAYVDSVCDGEVPADWHTRSAADQAVWNKEGTVTPPTTITAKYIVENLDMAPLYKPALVSIADAGTVLLGRSEDPGAEDANRNQVDFLRISAAEMKLLRDSKDISQSWRWETVVVGGMNVDVLRKNI